MKMIRSMVLVSGDVISWSAVPSKSSKRSRRPFRISGLAMKSR